MAKLRSIYKLFKISFKKVKIRRSWRRPNQTDKIESDRIMFRLMKRQIEDAIANGKEVVFADECVFHQRICV